MTGAKAGSGYRAPAVHDPHSMRASRWDGPATRTVTSSFADTASGPCAPQVYTVRRGVLRPIRRVGYQARGNGSRMTSRPTSPQPPFRPDPRFLRLASASGARTQEQTRCLLTHELSLTGSSPTTPSTGSRREQSLDGSILRWRRNGVAQHRADRGRSPFERVSVPPHDRRKISAGGLPPAVCRPGRRR